MLSDRATRWVNEKLAERGLSPVDELEPGTRWSPWACPLRRTFMAAGLRPIVAKDGIYWDDMARWEDLPADVRAFIKAFDHEEYPELDVAKLPRPALRTEQHPKPRRHHESRRHTRLRSLTTA